MVQLWINGTQITDYILTTPFKDTIDEELDSLNFQFKRNSRFSITKNDKVVYNIYHGVNNILSKKFCVYNIVETWEGEKWLYQVSCLSPTKILENIIINGMAETYTNIIGGINTTKLYDQIVRVVAKINAQLQLDGTNITLSLDNSFSSVLQNQASSDFLWDNQVNAREILNDMLDKADMLVVASDYTINANSLNKVATITLSAVKREKKGTQLINSANDIDNGGLNDVKEMVKGITFNRNSEFACGNIISLTKNAIAKDNVQQPYLPARNTDLTIDDEAKWHIITQEPIYSLNSVRMETNIDGVGLIVYENGNIKYIIGGEQIATQIDITDYIVEKNVFDAMPLSEQKKRLYFIRGQKHIYGLFDRYKVNPLQSNTAIKNIIEDIESRYFWYTGGTSTKPITDLKPRFLFEKMGRFNLNDDFNTFINFSNDSIIVGNQSFIDYGSLSDLVEENFYYDGRIGAGLDPSEILGTSNALKKGLKFSVNYQPYVDSVVKIEKEVSVDARSENLCVIKNQSDRTIDAVKYYDSQQALINRMGNKEMFMDCMIDLTATYSHLKSLWDLGDYMTLNGTNWTITQRTLENYNENKLKVRYTLSKEFNASNVDIQVNRDKRLYGIPLDNYVNRYIIIKLGNQQSLYKKLAIKCYDDFTNDTTTTGYSLMELVAIGNNDITDKVARCMDNYAVDIERTKYSSTIVNVYLRYGDSDGFAEDIELMLISDTYWTEIQNNLITDYSRLPFIAGTSIQAYGTYKKLTGIKKDKMERLIFVFKE